MIVYCCAYTVTTESRSHNLNSLHLFHCRCSVSHWHCATGFSLCLISMVLSLFLSLLPFLLPFLFRSICPAEATYLQRIHNPVCDVVKIEHCCRVEHVHFPGLGCSSRFMTGAFLGRRRSLLFLPLPSLASLALDPFAWLWAFLL